MAAGVDVTLIRNWLGHVHLDTTVSMLRPTWGPKRKSLEQAGPNLRQAKPLHWKQDADLSPGWVHFRSVGGIVMQGSAVVETLDKRSPTYCFLPPSVGCAALCLQNMSFSASCAARGPPIWNSGLRPPVWPPAPREAPSIWVAWPNSGEVM